MEQIIHYKLKVIYILIYIILILLLLSVYNPFSDRVGLPLHIIPSPFIYGMEIFFVVHNGLSMLGLLLFALGLGLSQSRFPPRDS